MKSHFEGQLFDTGTQHGQRRNDETILHGLKILEFAIVERELSWVANRGCG